MDGDGIALLDLYSPAKVYVRSICNYIVGAYHSITIGMKNEVSRYSFFDS